MLRRFEDTAIPADRLHVHDIAIDKDRYVVTKGEEEYQLLRKEFELLYFLASRKGKVMDRQTFLNEVWGDIIYVTDRTVDVHVRKIREKLEDEFMEAHGEEFHIESIPNEGSTFSFSLTKSEYAAASV